MACCRDLWVIRVESSTAFCREFGSSLPQHVVEILDDLDRFCMILLHFGASSCYFMLFPYILIDSLAPPFWRESIFQSCTL